jgi:hypothetical protein
MEHKGTALAPLTQDVGNALQSARANAVRTILVFLDLLE